MSPHPPGYRALWKPVRERWTRASCSWLARYSWQPWTKLPGISHNGWQPGRQSEPLATKRGRRRKKSDNVHTAVELQIDHGKGPFPAGLSAGGRTDAAVSERSGKKGSSLAWWVLLPSSDGHRRCYGSNIFQHSADIQSLWLTSSVSCRLTTCAIRIPVKGSSRQTTLVNVYYPGGSKKIDEVAWLENLNPDASSWVVAGDFNVSNRLWDATAADSNGLHLAETVSDSNLLLLNGGSITRIGHRGQRSTAIDLTMVTPDLHHVAHWSTGVDHLQSDHLPLHLMLGEADTVLAETDRAPKYQYQQANWQQFQSTLNDQCCTVDPLDACIDTYFENIRNMILKTAAAAISKRAPGARGVHQHSSKWWNEECAAATSAKRRALRTFRKKKNMSEDNKEALREASHSCQAVEDNTRQEHWERFCTEKIAGPEDTSKIWKKVRELRRRARKPERPSWSTIGSLRGCKRRQRFLLVSSPGQVSHGTSPRRWPGAERKRRVASKLLWWTI